MPTPTTFQNVYREARDIFLGVDGADAHTPHDPVVRRYETPIGGRWAIGSALDPPQDATVTISLDDFDMYWQDAFIEEFEPGDADEQEFVAILAEWARDGWGAW